MKTVCTLEAYEANFPGRHLVHGVVEYWAKRKPTGLALIHHDRGQTTTWAAFDAAATALARRMLGLGLAKGDFFAACLPMSPEHLLIEYACFKIGVIHVPLDLRLRPQEIARALSMIRAKAFAYVGSSCDAVASLCPGVEHWISVSPAEKPIDAPPVSEAEYREAAARVTENDGAQVIFTTGSTGSPKPALLSHRNITCQNYSLGQAFDFGESSRTLVNLPPSHVGGQAEALMTTLFWGGTAVLLETFDPGRSLDAIQTHAVTLIGQIPAMFQFEWRMPGFAGRDLSSLDLAIYGGQQVNRPFLEKLGTMAPRIATGLGLTEAAGFCTFTPLDSTVDDLAASIGPDMPVYPMTIREPMRDGGHAGSGLPDGEIGHVCFRGPQTFLGYVNDPDSTAQAISKDGYLYTGDMGFRDARGLHLSGRARWIIKPAGYQVFPGDVEQHLMTQPSVGACGVAGVEHRTLSEAIVAFVEPKPGATIDVGELRQHIRQIASYMRPLHYVVLAPGGLPLNRVAKIDYVRLSEMAGEEIAKLRSVGRWD